MSQPGWYPDPGGAPGQFRYWDGASWSSTITSTPHSSPAPSSASGRPPATVPTRRRQSPLLLAIAAVLALALGIVWFLNRGGNTPAAKEDTNTSRPTVSAWNETSKPSPAPSATVEPTNTGAAMVDCPLSPDITLPHPTGDGRLYGGFVSVEALPEPWYESYGVNWAVDQSGQYLKITDGWVSNSSVGALVRAEGFTGVQQSARAFMSCYASSSFYRGITGRTDVASKAMTVGGHPAWYLRTEVKVSYSRYPQIPGDVIDIVVVDTGNPQYLSFWLGNATIGDAPVQREIDRIRGTLRVES